MRRRRIGACDLLFVSGFSSDSLVIQPVPARYITRQCGVFQEPRGLGSEPLLLAMDRYFIHFRTHLDILGESAYPHLACLVVTIPAVLSSCRVRSIC
jgi:hypothetical protein